MDVDGNGTAVGKQLDIPDLADLDGDGHADVLVSEDDAFVWHESLAEEGFGPARRVSQALDEEEGPRLVFADGTKSIYLADLSGDGLTDLVRIDNGEICYWPNLGYGRFGAKVTMDDAPHFDDPDQFNHKRIRLADIDGTGTRREELLMDPDEAAMVWKLRNVLHSLEPAAAIGDPELDLRARLRGIDPRRERGGVQEHLTAVVGGDEAEPTIDVEPLDLAGRHRNP